jgi:hypothetical protein
LQQRAQPLGHGLLAQRQIHGLARISGEISFRPTNTSFRPDGGYYLGDGYGSNWIFQYDKNDQFVRAIGGGGKTDGKFVHPHDACFDKNGDIFVVEWVSTGRVSKLVKVG